MHRWLIRLVAATAVVAAVVVQWFSGTTAGAAFVLLALWGSSRFLSPMTAKLVALAVMIGSVSTLLLQDPTTLIGGLDQMAVITGARDALRRVRAQRLRYRQPAKTIIVPLSVIPF